MFDVIDDIHERLKKNEKALAELYKMFDYLEEKINGVITESITHSESLEDFMKIYIKEKKNAK